MKKLILKNQRKMNNQIMGIIMKKQKKRLTPIRAIRFYCKEMCCVSDLQSWKYCSCSNCALFPYRMGKRPKETATHSKKQEKQQAISQLPTKDSTEIGGKNERE